MIWRRSKAGMRNLDISCKTGVFLIEIRRFENNKARYFKKIIRNKIRRKKYGDIIESESAHDYETCSCGACSVDGGHYYLKRSAASPDDYPVPRNQRSQNRSFHDCGIVGLQSF